MSEDAQIVETADKWEAARLAEQARGREESARRFNAVLGLVKRTLITLMLLAAAAGIVYMIVDGRAEERELALETAKETRLRGEEHTRAYQACLHAGIGDTCACLWDANACRPQAAAQCREHLPSAVCACLDDAKTCGAPAYQTCLLKMSETDCRCLANVDLCKTSEDG